MKTPFFWRTNNFISTLLRPVSWLYGIGAALDRCRTTPQRATLPVIAIGNVTAGGAGKTPTVLALIPVLKALGHTPHILTRGYKGEALTAHRVTPSDRWEQVGDEALLLAAIAPTWVGRDRLASARAAAAAGATILVCDDALQHHRLHKDITLLVLDGAYGIGNGHLLPAGPLRESLASGLARSTAVVLIGDDEHKLLSTTDKPVLSAQLRICGDVDFLKHDTWIAFAGIARPEKLFDTLKTLGTNLIAQHRFADHHAYTKNEIETLIAAAEAKGASLITTTKDAVRLPPELRAQVAVLPIELIWNDEAALRAILGKS